MRFSSSLVAPAALATLACVPGVAQAAMFADNFSSTTGGFSLQAIYDSASGSTNFTLTSPKSGSAYGWHGIGTGRGMAGSNMVVSWVASDGSVVVSPRHATDEVMPTTTGRTLPDIEVNKAQTVSAQSGVTVNWVQPGFPAASDDKAQTRMIWAFNSNAPSSTDPAATITYHDSRGFITLDLTKPYTAGSTVSSSPAASSDDTVGEGDHTLTKRAKIIIAHMVFMIVGWLLLLPAGVLIARFGRGRFTWFPHHRAVQWIGILVIFVGMFLGFGTLWSIQAPHFTYRHEVLGLALCCLAIFQGLLGAAGHHIRRVSGVRIQNFLHMLIGITIIPLAVWNMGEGFPLWAEWQPPKWAPYPLYAWGALLAVIYIAGLALWPRQIKAEREAANGDATRAGSNTSVEGKAWQSNGTI